MGALRSGELSGDKAFSKLCHGWLERHTGSARVLLTTSGTHALEMAALLANLRPGDEVIVPSFTFPSTANAFVLRGAQAVFVDIRPDTLNLDEKKIEAAITPRTRAIVPVHYGGVACEMSALDEIARDHGLLVIEDAASAMLAKYRGEPLGSLGDLGCYSFHETKNLSAGEGGALLVNRHELSERAEILREKGTNRAQFFRREVSRYTWLDCGSSYLPSDLTAALLLSQLEMAEEILENRLACWNFYRESLAELERRGEIRLPHVPADCEHNGHTFHLRLKSEKERDRFQRHLSQHGIGSAFHYVPLHSSPAGKKFGRFHGQDRHTTRESSRLVRLPLYHGLKYNDLTRVVTTIRKFFRPRRKSTAARPARQDARLTR